MTAGQSETSSQASKQARKPQNKLASFETSSQALEQARKPRSYASIETPPSHRVTNSTV